MLENRMVVGEYAYALPAEEPRECGERHFIGTSLMLGVPLYRTCHNPGVPGTESGRCAECGLLECAEVQKAADAGMLSNGELDGLAKDWLLYREAAAR